MCNSDRNNPIKVECYDWDSTGSDDFIGAFETTLEHLISVESKFELRNPKSKKKLSGIIEVVDVVHKKKESFIDYLCNGLQLSLIFVVDFYDSVALLNPDSLHYRDSLGMSKCERAILEVGTILNAYDNLKDFKVYGIGSVIKNSHKCSPQYFSMKNENNSHISSISNILELYRSTEINEIEKPVLRKLIDKIFFHKVKKSYYVMVVFTTSFFYYNFEHHLINTSTTPISIIFICIGDSDFNEENKVNNPFTYSYHNRNDREFAQFVRFNYYKGNPDGLTAKLLKELSDDIVDYMHNNIDS